MAVDADYGSNAELTFSLVGTHSDLFLIDAQTGVIVTNSTFDLEETRNYSGLLLRVMDSGGFESNASLEVVIVDSNDHTPEFPIDELRSPPLSELTPVGTEIAMAMAVDLDEGSNGEVTYSLTGLNFERGEFAIGPTTGSLVINNTLDYETTTSYEFNITATDGGVPPRQSHLRLTIIILDENDNPPVFLNPFPTFNVTENTTVRTTVGQIQATDADTAVHAVIEYVLTENVPFSIGPNGILTVEAPLDRETQEVYLLTVEVRVASHW